MIYKDKARKLYRDCYTRWCHELSHDKNVLMAKSMCLYICREVLGDMGADRGYEFWTDVRDYITNASHADLFERAILKFNGGNLALLCSNCSVIIKEGKDFTTEELAFAKGDKDYLPVQYCESCKNKQNDSRKT